MLERDDLMAVAMARQIRDGWFVAHGTSVPLAAAALMLAKKTHAPNVDFLFQGTLNPTNAGPEQLHVDMTEIYRSAVAQASHATMIDLELRGRCDFQFLRPIQIDASGNINASLVGTLREPRFRFHGLGLGDAVGVVGRVCLYVTEHTPRVFAPSLAFHTGLGHGRGAEIRKAVGLDGRGPAAVVTPLCVIDFETPGRTARLRETFPGVTPEEVQEQTGFELALHDAVPFDPPSENELAVLAEIDPHRMRRMEFREWRGDAQARLSERRAD